jgi:hypothetical protein
MTLFLDLALFGAPPRSERRNLVRVHFFHMLILCTCQLRRDPIKLVLADFQGFHDHTPASQAQVLQQQDIPLFISTSGWYCISCQHQCMRPITTNRRLFPYAMPLQSEQEGCAQVSFHFEEAFFLM